MELYFESEKATLQYTEAPAFLLQKASVFAVKNLCYC